MRLATTLLVALLLVCTGCGDRAHKPSAGPLASTSEDRSWSGAPVKPGEFLVVGVWLEQNESGHDLVLDQLVPDDASRAEGLEMRYAAVRVPQDGCQVGALRGWVPRGCAGRTHPVAGYRVRPGARTEILVGARSTTEGSWFIPAFRLEYGSGSNRYVATFNQGMRFRVSARSKY